jgi:hypothetical protein
VHAALDRALRPETIRMIIVFEAADSEIKVLVCPKLHSNTWKTLAAL